MAKSAAGRTAARPLLVSRAGRKRKSGASETHLDLKLWLRLLNLTNQIRRLLAARLRREFNTSMARFDLLAQLERADQPGLSMTELSARAMVTNGAITGLVDGLVQDGLVRREAQSHDRRTVIVGLTTSGRRKFLTMARRHERWVIELFSGVPVDLKGDFQQHLSLMKQQFQRAAPDFDRRLTLRREVH
jgi:DNA-binding MarR family transcriptional regulator